MGAGKAYYDRWYERLSQEAWEIESILAHKLDPHNLEERIEQDETLRVSALTLQEDTRRGDRRASAVHTRYFG